MAERIPDRRITMYTEVVDTPGDLVPGETERLPVVRGDGPREGELMGMADVTMLDDGEVKVRFLPEDAD